jgi:hypothetical protein
MEGEKVGRMRRNYGEKGMEGEKAEGRERKEEK